MTLASSQRTNNDAHASFDSSRLTLQVDGHLSKEIVGLEPIVIPNRELEHLVLQFFAMHVPVDRRVFPHGIEILGDMFRSTFVLLTRTENALDTAGSSACRS